VDNPSMMDVWHVHHRWVGMNGWTILHGLICDTWGSIQGIDLHSLLQNCTRGATLQQQPSHSDAKNSAFLSLLQKGAALVQNRGCLAAAAVARMSLLRHIGGSKSIKSVSECKDFQFLEENLNFENMFLG
jgi:hypothetical protein